MSRLNHWTALRQRRISRRTMLGASAKAGVGVAGLALVGCGDDDEPDAGAVAAERAASAAEEAAAAAIAAGEARAADSEAAAAVAAGAADAAAGAADAAADAADAAGEASAAASQAASAADAAAALAAEAAESEDAANAAAAAEAAAAAAAQAADAASAAGDAAAAAVADAAAEAAEAAAQAARDVAAAVEAGTATAEAAQAAIDNAAEAAAAAAAAAGEASAAAGAAAAAAGQAAATAQETAEAAAETAAAAVAAAEEAADAAQEAAESAAMAAAEDEAPATGPQHGGTLTFPGLDGGIFDPAIANHGGTDSLVLPIYDHLNWLDNGGVLTSAMAELPEVVDDLTFVYNIKPNVYWQDKAPLNGRQFLAEDASFGLQRFGQDNPEFIWRDRYASVGQYDVVNHLTMRITAKEPFAPLLTAVAETQALMISRDAVEAFGDDGIANNIEAAIGTGGVQHVSREADVLTVLERNPNYFRDGLPYFDRFRIPWGLDLPHRVAQYVAGEHDFFNIPWLGRPAENDALRAEVGEENMVEVPMLALWKVASYFNTTIEPYTDPRVRKALHLAADRELMHDVFGNRYALAGPIGPASSPYGWTPDVLRQLPGYRSGDLREQDLAEARQLLDASGYDPASVQPMSVTVTHIAGVQVMQQNFAEIGFEIGLEEYPDTEHLARRAAGEFTISTQGQGGELDPDVLYGPHHSAGARNFGEFSDPEIDALLEQGRTTLGTENRLPIYDEIQTKLLEEHNPQIYWAFGASEVAHRPWVKGYGPTNSSTAATQQLYRSWFEGKPGV